MANVIYVGNYPSDFTDEDILKVFEDFEGVEFIRSVKQGIKCFSFLLCQDQEQVINVVLSLHDTEVGGRNLIVRASDDELQELIEDYDFDEEYYEEETNEPSSANNHFNYKSNPHPTANGRFRQPHNPSRLVVSNESDTGNMPVKKSFASPVNDHKEKRSFSRNTSKYDHKYQEDKVVPETSKGYKGLSQANKRAHDSNFDHLETASSCASYSNSVRSFNTSPVSTVSSRYSSKGRCEKFSFVSINNFCNGTTLEELNDLLSDFDPLKIIMKRNTSYDEDTLTEAIVCFLKSNNATSAILHLDNTLHRGRVLILTECDDILELTELMKLHA